MGLNTGQKALNVFHKVIDIFGIIYIHLIDYLHHLGLAPFQVVLDMILIL